MITTIKKRISKNCGVEFVAYDKEYTDEALDNDEYDKQNDEIDLIKKKILILMYIHMMNQIYYKLTEGALLIMMTHYI